MKLSEAIDRYVNGKRRDGIGFLEGEAWLRQLSAREGDLPLQDLSVLSVVTYLDACSRTPHARQTKGRLLFRFFDHWVARGMMMPLSIPLGRPKVNKVFLPYVYRHSEVRKLLEAALQLETKVMERKVFQMLLLLSYATGAAPEEFRRLRRHDVHLSKRTLDFASLRRGMRTVPMSSELRDALKLYIAWRFESNPLTDYLFTTKNQAMLTHTQIGKCFTRLCTLAGVDRGDGHPHNPRMQDFRTTFAVHRITAWMKDGVDLNKMLPALATYMGRRSLLAGQEYFRMTPERFRKQLDALSPDNRPRLFN
jgi:integrase/recombinase XerD